MNFILRAFNGLEKTFSSFKYIAVLLVVSLVFYTFNVIAINLINLSSFYRALGIKGALDQFFTSFVFFYKTLPLEIYINLIILSLLTGILVSLLVYRWKYVKELRSRKGGVLAGAGLFLGVIAPGCASCGIGLIALLGLTASVASLPFQGSEVTWVATILLLISIFMVSDKIGKGFICDDCLVPHGNSERRSKLNGKNNKRSR